MDRLKFIKLLDGKEVDFPRSIIYNTDNLEYFYCKVRTYDKADKSKYVELRIYMNQLDENDIKFSVYRLEGEKIKHLRIAHKEYFYSFKQIDIYEEYFKFLLEHTNIMGRLALCVKQRKIEEENKRLLLEEEQKRKEYLASLTMEDVFSKEELEELNQTMKF